MYTEAPPLFLSGLIFAHGRSIPLFLCQTADPRKLILHRHGSLWSAWLMPLSGQVTPGYETA